MNCTLHENTGSLRLGSIAEKQQAVSNNTLDQSVRGQTQKGRYT